MQLAGELSAALTVAGVIVFVLSLAVMQERAQEHESHIGSRCLVGEF